MNRLARVLLGFVVAVAVFAVVFVAGMRKKSPAVLDAVRKTLRFTRPLVLKSAGTKGSNTSVVRHVGRRSGRDYETPVVAVPVEGGFVIALPYGENTDWAKNVLAQGHATIVFDGDAYEVKEPAVVGIEKLSTYFPERERRLQRQFNVSDALLVRSATAAAETPVTS